MAAGEKEANPGCVVSMLISSSRAGRVSVGEEWKLFVRLQGQSAYEQCAGAYCSDLSVASPSAGSDGMWYVSGVYQSC